jgi:MFS transporter, DHA2 family, methylenomycin A resistance protein
MLTGYTMIGGGLLSLLLVQPESGYPLIGVLFGILGVGMGFAITTTNSAGVSAVGRERSGTAAATVNAARQTGTALGIAALGAIVNASLDAGFTTGLHRALLLAGALSLVAAALIAVVRTPAQPEYGIAEPAGRAL